MNLSNDINSLKNEISKIIAYIGDRDTVTAQDIEAVASFVDPDNIFLLIDNIATGKQIKLYRF